MSTFSMCLENRCPIKKQCRRHPDSGTAISRYKKYTIFVADHNTLKNPVKECSGYLRCYEVYRGKPQ